MKAPLESERDVDWSAGGREREREREESSRRTAREAAGCGGERSQESRSHRSPSLSRLPFRSKEEADEASLSEMNLRRPIA